MVIIFILFIDFRGEGGERGVGEERERDTSIAAGLQPWPSPQGPQPHGASGQKQSPYRFIPRTFAIGAPGHCPPQILPTGLL